MLGITSWARDLLVSRGALVEEPSDEGLRALLPPEVARALGCGEWLSVDFSAGAGADDPGEWLERFGRLLDARVRVAGARLRSPWRAGPVDTAAVLARELVIQNGVYRLMEDFPSVAPYYLFSFHYSVESDESNMGFLTIALNAASRSVVAQPETFFLSFREELEEDPAFQLPAEELARLYPAAAGLAQLEVRKLVTPLEQAANRRLARDAERVESYYRGLLEQIRKRIARRAADAEAAEKERSRARATELDRVAKLEDLRRKYSLRVRIEPADILAVSLPARQIRVRLIRKKEARERSLVWNPVLHRLDLPLCEHCMGAAHPLYLCEKVHCLCWQCWSACPRCGRFFCRACQPRCRCDKAAGNPLPRD